jgi:hypothetical protein
MAEGIRFAGDVQVENITITSLNGFYVNVTNQVIGVEVYEDLFSPFISGVLTIKESLDFANLIPLTGEEFVDLLIRTPSMKDSKNVISGQFHLYKMSNREEDGDRNLVYRLHFISKEAIVDLNKKVSKAFSGRVSDIAKTFLTDEQIGLETTKPYNVQETSNNTKYVSNFWSPIQNLNYLCSNATNARDGSSYIFFQNRNGFNFVSLESLYYQPVQQDFIKDSYFREVDQQGKSRRNIEQEYKRIIDINIPLAYDYMDNLRSGMYASNITTYDITTKKYSSKNFDMLDDFFNHNQLNQYPLTSKNNIYRSRAAALVMPKYYGNFTKFGDVTNTKTIQKRISELKQAVGNKLEITVPGRTDYTVGMKVSLKLYKTNPIKSQDQDIEDKIFSGNYLIGAINHFITRETHECRMELIKNSYMVNLDTGGKK